MSDMNNHSQRTNGSDFAVWKIALSRLVKASPMTYGRRGRPYITMIRKKAKGFFCAPLELVD